MKSKPISITMMVLSVIAVVLAALDAGGYDVWISATSWLLVGVVLGIWALYTSDCCK